MNVRAKFRVESVTHHIGGTVTVNSMAVGDDGIPENKRYHKYTPNGNMSLSVTNPAVAEKFKPGMSFYIDFSSAENPSL